MAASVTGAKSKKKQSQSNEEKDDDTFKVVLTNVHYSVDQESLINELESFGHKVVKITILKNSRQDPLPLLLIELERRVNNNEIFNIKEVWNLSVVFEPIHKKRMLIRRFETFDSDDECDDPTCALHYPNRFTARHGIFPQSLELPDFSCFFNPTPPMGLPSTSSFSGSSSFSRRQGPASDATTNPSSSSVDLNQNHLHTQASCSSSDATSNTFPTSSNANHDCVHTRGQSDSQGPQDCPSTETSPGPSTSSFPPRSGTIPNVPRFGRQRLPGQSFGASMNFPPRNRAPRSPLLQTHMYFLTGDPSSSGPEAIDFTRELKDRLFTIANGTSRLEQCLDTLSPAVTLLVSEVNRIIANLEQPNTRNIFTPPTSTPLGPTGPNSATRSNRSRPTPATPSSRSEPTPATPSNSGETNSTTTSNSAEPTPATSSSRSEPTPATPSKSDEQISATSSKSDEQTLATSSNSAEPTPATPSKSDEPISATSSNSDEQNSATSSRSDKKISVTSSKSDKQTLPTSSNSAEPTPATPSKSDKQNSGTSSKSYKKISATSSKSDEQTLATPSNSAEPTSATSSKSDEQNFATSSKSGKKISATSRKSDEQITATPSKSDEQTLATPSNSAEPTSGTPSKPDKPTPATFSKKKKGKKNMTSTKTYRNKKY